MATIGYHCSHEQHAPSALLRYVVAAERAGFGAAMCSDHFAPWSEHQGHSGFAWSWLGAALHATGLDFGTVTAPGQRYHPAILAQAAATLAEMYPERLWVALGTGEALNEHITGERWPAKPQRRQRLRECVDVMRALFAGETVTHEGLVKVHEARLYTRPQRPPLLFGAAISADTAEWVGSWADGLITVARPEAELRKVVERFRAGGGSGKPMYLQACVSFAPSEAEAEKAALDGWRTLAVGSDFKADVTLPQFFDVAARSIRVEDVRAIVRISADPARHAAWLERDRALGFERIYVHHVGADQERLIQAFSELVLPRIEAR
ncbi:MAG: TIGR03885 family FMN-dependent LLM class oxidoreductase [Myxococcota bacterium]|nr:TIGR03885 family FMN-dependent LLM class oxidoreductase [Myxococcota bacterium]